MAKKKKDEDVISDAQKRMFERFAEMIIDRMKEMKASDWKQGWANSSLFGGYPQNINGREYTGLNGLLLYLETQDKGYKTPVYLTWAQAQELELSVHEKHGFPVFCRFKSYRKQDAKPGEKKFITPSKYAGLSDEQKDNYKECWRKKVITVFNIDQTEMKELQPERYNAFLEKFKKPELKHDTDGMYTNLELDRMMDKQEWVCPIHNDKPSPSAFYRPLTDEITIPMKEQFNISKTPEEVFKDGMEYYSTALHEMAHSTGNESRLNRKYAYAKEELVAELTAAVVGMNLGFDKRIYNNNAAYLDSWIKDLSDDPKYIRNVFDDVNKAARMIDGKIVEQRKAIAEEQSTKDAQTIDIHEDENPSTNIKEMTDKYVAEGMSPEEAQEHANEDANEKTHEQYHEELDKQQEAEKQQETQKEEEAKAKEKQEQKSEDVTLPVASLVFYASVAHLVESVDKDPLEKLDKEGKYDELLVSAKEQDLGDDISLQNTYRDPKNAVGDVLVAENDDYAVVRNDNNFGYYDILRKVSEDAVISQLKEEGYSDDDIEDNEYTEDVAEVAHGLQRQDRAEIAKQFSEIDKIPAFTMDNDDLLYFQYNEETNQIEVGGVTNTGLMPEHKFDYDQDLSLDDNLQGVYEQLSEMPEYQKSEETEEIQEKEMIGKNGYPLRPATEQDFEKESPTVYVDGKPLNIIMIENSGYSTVEPNSESHITGLFLTDGRHHPLEEIQVEDKNLKISANIQKAEGLVDQYLSDPSSRWGDTSKKEDPYYALDRVITPSDPGEVEMIDQLREKGQLDAVLAFYHNDRKESDASDYEAVMNEDPDSQYKKYSIIDPEETFHNVEKATDEKMICEDDSMAISFDPTDHIYNLWAKVPREDVLAHLATEDVGRADMTQDLKNLVQEAGVAIDDKKDNAIYPVADLGKLAPEKMVDIMSNLPQRYTIPALEKTDGQKVYFKEDSENHQVVAGTLDKDYHFVAEKTREIDDKVYIEDNFKDLSRDLLNLPEYRPLQIGEQKAEQKEEVQTNKESDNVVKEPEPQIQQEEYSEEEENDKENKIVGYLQIEPQYLKELSEDFPSVYTPDMFRFVEDKDDLYTDKDYENVLGKDFDWDCWQEVTVLPLNEDQAREYNWWAECDRMSEYQRENAGYTYDNRNQERLWVDIRDEVIRTQAASIEKAYSVKETETVNQTSIAPSEQPKVGQQEIVTKQESQVQSEKPAKETSEDKNSSKLVHPEFEADVPENERIHFNNESGSISDAFEGVPENINVEYVGDKDGLYIADIDDNNAKMPSQDISSRINLVHDPKGIIDDAARVYTYGSSDEVTRDITDTLEKDGYNVQHDSASVPFVDFQKFDNAVKFAGYVDQVQNLVESQQKGKEKTQTTETKTSEENVNELTGEKEQSEKEVGQQSQKEADKPKEAEKESAKEQQIGEVKENTKVKQDSPIPEKQKEHMPDNVVAATLLVSALDRALAHDGAFMNRDGKGAPAIVDKDGNKRQPSAFNTMMMALDSDQHDRKTNLYTFYQKDNEAMTIRKGEHAIPYEHTEWRYVNPTDRSNPISKEEYDKLPDEEKSLYRSTPVNNDTTSKRVFNIDQTLMPVKDKDGYSKAVSEYGKSIETVSSIREDNPHNITLHVDKDAHLVTAYNDSARKASGLLRLDLVPADEKMTAATGAKEYVRFPMEKLDHYLPRLMQGGNVAVQIGVTENRLVGRAQDGNKIVGEAYKTITGMMNSSDVKVDAYQRAGGAMYYNDTVHYSTLHPKNSGIVGVTGDLMKANGIYRAVVAATGAKSRLDRQNRENLLPEDEKKYEQLVRELAAGTIMVKQGLPAVLSEKSRQMVPYWKQELKDNPKIMDTLKKDVNNAVEVVEKWQARQSVDYSKMRDNRPSFNRSEDFKINDDLAKLTNAQTGEVVVVKDAASKHADVMVPKEIQDEAVIAAITSTLKKGGIEDVQIHAARGKEGLNKPNKFFEGKEITLAAVKKDVMEEVKNVDVSDTLAAEKQRRSAMKLPDISRINTDRIDRWPNGRPQVLVEPTVNGSKEATGRYHVSASIDGEWHTKGINRATYSHMFDFEDKSDYKFALAAISFSDILGMKEPERKEGQQETEQNSQSVSEGAKVQSSENGQSASAADSQQASMENDENRSKGQSLGR
ncbi:MAG: zincin-like metallopeptidase domain-containing protein [Prevotellaceae bacterium]|nr:zincin-like metallopeptidase domain-containing protein [Prevotellaceae bacterium]